MFLIITKDNKRYTVDSIKHKGDGIFFEYNKEMIFLSSDKIKSIDANVKKLNAKAYIKKK